MINYFLIGIQIAKICFLYILPIMKELSFLRGFLFYILCNPAHQKIKYGSHKYIYKLLILIECL